MSRDERALQAGLSDPAVPRALATAELEVLGLLPNASNHTFLVRPRADDGEHGILAVYKPRRGETPLWDFPEGTLCAREVATYVVARTLGWPNVPATVLRDGPFGIGSVQRFVPSEPDEHYFTLAERFPAEFRRVAAFDLVINNADRKAGHCLLGEDGRIHVVDHGVCFSDEPKLRTVIWDFIGEPIEETVREDLAGWPTTSRAGGCAKSSPTSSPSPSWPPWPRARGRSRRSTASRSPGRIADRSPGRRSDAPSRHRRHAPGAVHGPRGRGGGDPDALRRRRPRRGGRSRARGGGGPAPDGADPPRGRGVLRRAAPCLRDARRPLRRSATASPGGCSRPSARSRTASCGPTGTSPPRPARAAPAARRAARSRAARSSCSSPATASSAPGRRSGATAGTTTGDASCSGSRGAPRAFAAAVRRWQG